MSRAGRLVDGTRRFLRSLSRSHRSASSGCKGPVRTSAGAGCDTRPNFPSPARTASQGSIASANEDCLYLNVWSPQPPPLKRRSWLESMGRERGRIHSRPVADHSALWFDGRFFANARHRARHDQLPLASWDSSACRATGGRIAFGNQGLLDHERRSSGPDNIGAFGGDSRERDDLRKSAGATDVAPPGVAAQPWSFHRAISQSGGFTARRPRRGDRPNRCQCARAVPPARGMRGASRPARLPARPRPPRSSAEARRSPAPTSARARTQQPFGVRRRRRGRFRSERTRDLSNAATLPTGLS